MNVPGFDYQAIAAWREQRGKGAISVARHFASLDHLLGLSIKENTWKRWKVSSISRWSWTNNVWSMKLLWTNVWSLGFTLLAKGRPVAGRRGFAVTVAVSQSNLFLPCPISISAHRSTYTMVLGFDDAMDAVCLSFPEIRFLCPLTWSVWMNYSCSGICRSFLVFINMLIIYYYFRLRARLAAPKVPPASSITCVRWTSTPRLLVSVSRALFVQSVIYSTCRLNRNHWN